MLKLSFTLSSLLCAAVLYGQSPHGKNFAADCANCHGTTGWKVVLATMKFDHDTTSFKLTGQHKTVDCRTCHISLEFALAKKECIACHDDLHENTLGPECSRCHTTNSWIVENISSIHQLSRFPLTGAHQITDCRACHKSGSTRRFDLLGIQCVDCHMTNYLATTKPNHQQAGYSTNCIQCHKGESAGWLAQNIEHSFFPLTGGHSISCALCHTNGNYTKIPTDCYSCHQPQYAASTAPNHQLLNFSTNCQDCHTNSPKWTPARFTDHDSRFFPVYSGRHAEVWNSCTDCHKQSANYSIFTCIDCHAHNKSSMDSGHRETSGYVYNSVSCFACHPRGTREGGFNHTKTNFPLTGAHQNTDCIRCHTTGFALIATDCNSCHKDKYDQSQVPVHATAGISTVCEPCHNTSAWKPSTFNHTATGYPLAGGHGKVVQCSDCHKGSVQNTKTECIACHQTQFDGAKDHKAQSFPLDCKMCHSFDNWTTTSFNHAQTNFPLTGAHQTVLCAACHATSFTGTPTQCNSCHAPVFASSQNPNHVAAGIPTQCETCHTTTAWKPSSFNHVATGFALTGGHARLVQCSDCHKGTLLYAKTECIACHQVQYDNAKDHRARSYPLDCTGCHNTDNWINATFDHSKTIFPLTGAHATTLCSLCHSAGFAGTPTDCNSCHAASFTSSANPGHVAAGIPNVCEPCHNTTAWKPSTFNHITTGFALTGGHLRLAQCSDCHKGTVLNSKPDCISCHQAQYDGAKDHKAQSFPLDCTICHNTENWVNSSFDHSKTTFPLTGAHITTLCAKCHTSGFSGTPTDCNACHAAVFTSSVNPSHVAAGIPTLCSTCHNTTAWKPSNFSHVTTGFALTGGHARIVQCSDCHKGTVLNAPTQCIACHQAQYDNAKDHKAQAYPTDCRICHNSDNWLNSTFNHSSTAFPLTGVHLTTLCAQCHTNGFSNTPTACVSCHQAKYDGATNPNHKTLGLALTCGDCHTTSPNWTPATFPIHNNYFVLSGAHATIGTNCALCHNGNYATTPNTCYGCHSAKYNGTTNPNHTAAHFPTDCAPCHTVTAWTPATWNHDNQYFPIYSGHHRGKWTLCTECHTTATNYAVYSCIICHAHSNKSSVDGDHRGVSGYSYTSTACYSCHPRG